jgi:hypothetical protein
MYLTITLHILCKFYTFPTWLTICFISLFLPIMSVVEMGCNIGSSLGQACWCPPAASPTTGVSRRTKEKMKKGACAIPWGYCVRIPLLPAG